MLILSYVLAFVIMLPAFAYALMTATPPVRFAVGEIVGWQEYSYIFSLSRLRIFIFLSLS